MIWGSLSIRKVAVPFVIKQQMNMLFSFHDAKPKTVSYARYNMCQQLEREEQHNESGLALLIKLRDISLHTNKSHLKAYYYQLLLTQWLRQSLICASIFIFLTTIIDHHL